MDDCFPALLGIFFIILAVGKPVQSQAEEIIQYELQIFSSSSYSSASLSVANLSVTLLLSQTPRLILNGTTTVLSEEEILSILESPDISHFILSQKQMNELMSTGKLDADNWSLLYTGRSAFQLLNGRFVEGPEVIILFNYGSKNAMYDSSTGILIWENFFVSTSSSSGYEFFLEALPSEKITGTSIPTWRLEILEIAIALLLILSIYAIVMRKRYRIM